METLGTVLIVAGMIMVAIGGIWFIIAAFSESIWWGLGCLLLPIIPFVFLIVHWEVAAKPFWYQVLGGMLYVIGILMIPGTIM